MRLAVLLNRLQLSNSHRKALLECVIQQGGFQGLLLLLFCQSQGVALLLPQAGSVLSPQECTLGQVSYKIPILAAPSV